jgi:translation initiation factor 2 beta subunit (eIF-2beta)/eIF-5
MKAQLRSFITYYVACPECEHEIILGDEYPRREMAVFTLGMVI